MDFVTLSTITSTVIALVSLVVSVSVGIWQFSRSKIADEESRLHSQHFDILKILMEYPYLQDSNFTNTWNREQLKTDDAEKYKRYDTYCCMRFNLLAELFHLYKGDHEKINKFSCVDDVIRAHWKWWKNPINPGDNTNGYTDEKFVKYIDSLAEPYQKKDNQQ